MFSLFSLKAIFFWIFPCPEAFFSLVTSKICPANWAKLPCFCISIWNSETYPNSRPAKGRPRPKVTITAQAYMLQAEFYTFVTNMEAWLYLLEVSVAASFLHLCHKNLSLALPTIGECCSQFFHLCHKNGSLALPTRG